MKMKTFEVMKKDAETAWQNYCFWERRVSNNSDDCLYDLASMRVAWSNFQKAEETLHDIEGDEA